MTKVAIQFVDKVFNFDDIKHDAAGTMYRHDLAAGSAHWTPSMTRDYAALGFTCPCGCGSVHCLPVCQATKENGHWLWDGNIKNPTLTPSIRCTTPCGWHGYLKNGIFEKC